ncbi:MAG TPA: YaiO family outer membrane beta-barrel protein [Prolixibacteraceae bacterium]|nr:YaiO family outer membrane beta-barrel protein [Prolixibacteraceae bacterium]
MKTFTGRRFSLLLFLLLGGGFSTMLSAQTFEQAKDYAFNGQREKARAVCRAILARDFDSDVATLMGRTYAWDGKYDSARVVLQKVLTQNANNSDALSALADVAYWSENYPEAIGYCDRILAKDPGSETVQLQKARILKSADNNDEAAQLLEKLLEKNPSNDEALRLLDKVRLELIKNKLTINYTYDYFSNTAYNKDPWQLLYLQYARKTGLGTVIARVNYANRFGKDALQLEADAYPKLSENDYLYVNYGFSNFSIFPRQRAGLEWNRSFAHAIEGSLGGRILHFDGSKRVIIYTGSIGKYVGNYWFSLRPFVTPGGGGTSVSAYLSARRYFSDPENYIGLRVGAGTSPDERRLLLFDQSQSARLKSLSARTEYNHIFNGRWIFNAAVGFANEEYWVPQDDRMRSGNDLSLQLGFAWLF